MANQQRPSEREKSTNGLAHDVDVAVSSAASKVSGWRPELQGYLMLAAGVTLLLFAFGFFPVLKWVAVAGAVLLIAWGTVRSNIVAKTANFIESYRSR